MRKADLVVGVQWGDEGKGFVALKVATTLVIRSGSMA